MYKVTSILSVHLDRDHGTLNIIFWNLTIFDFNIYLWDFFCLNKSETYFKSIRNDWLVSHWFSSFKTFVLEDCKVYKVPFDKNWLLTLRQIKLMTFGVFRIQPRWMSQKLWIGISHFRNHLFNQYGKFICYEKVICNLHDPTHLCQGQTKIHIPICLRPWLRS